MMKLFSCLFCGLTAAVTASAGGVPADREAAYQQYLDYQHMIGGGRVTAHWLPDGSTFWTETGGPKRPGNPQGRPGREYG